MEDVDHRVTCSPACHRGPRYYCDSFKCIYCHSFAYATDFDAMKPILSPFVWDQRRIEDASFSDQFRLCRWQSAARVFPFWAPPLRHRTSNLASVGTARD